MRTLPFLLLLAACGGETPETKTETPSTETPATETPATETKAETPSTEATGGDMAGMNHAGAMSVHIVEPADGATVTSPVKVVFAVDGMTVAPAGTTDANTGHHHLIVDGDAVPKGTTVPNDATHLHFGKGQTDTTVELTPGAHALTLQFADGNHVSYGPEMAQTIHVTVSGAAPAGMAPAGAAPAATATPPAK